MGRPIPLTYTRPKHVSQHSVNRQQSRSSTESEGDKASGNSSEGSVKSGRSGLSAGIPESLTFDKIVNSGTCPPMTVRDFMNYLFYIEHAAENLQFYLWHKDYVKRFESANTADIALAPEWTQDMQDDAVARIRKDNVEKMRANMAKSAPANAIFKGTDFEPQPQDFAPPRALNNASDPFATPRTSHSNSSLNTDIYGGSSLIASSYTSQAADAFHSAGAKLPFTIQPFREEINRVVATYIMDGGSRQLNLASWEQKAAVQALSYTTHPSALRGLIKTVESSLRCQAHPNFVRWSICNGNPARVVFARGLGVVLIVVGFAIAITMTLSGMGRGYRALAAITWVLGISTLIAAYKGMCVVLHGMHHRHVRPWELFDQEGDEMKEKIGTTSFESFGTSNSYESEPWVVKYEKRNVIRKVFDREVWIQEPALRQIQDVIFIQAILGALLFGGALTGVFIAIPQGNFF